MSTNNALNVNASTPLNQLYGGTGVSNIGTFTYGGNTSFIGVHTFAGTLTADTAVTFPVAGTLATTAQTFPFVNISGTTQAAAVNTGYIIGNAAQTSVTTPAIAAVGDRVAIVGQGAGGWVLAANTGQTIHVGSVATTVAGSVTSANLYDTIEIICVVANTTWVTRSVLSSGVTVA